MLNINDLSPVELLNDRFATLISRIQEVEESTEYLIAEKASRMRDFWNE